MCAVRLSPYPRVIRKSRVLARPCPGGWMREGCALEEGAARAGHGRVAPSYGGRSNGSNPARLAAGGAGRRDRRGDDAADDVPRPAGGAARCVLQPLPDRLRGGDLRSPAPRPGRRRPDRLPGEPARRDHHQGLCAHPDPGDGLRRPDRTCREGLGSGLNSVHDHGFGCPPVSSSTFFVPVFWPTRLLRPKRESNTSSQKGAPALRTRTVISQPRSVLTPSPTHSPADFLSSFDQNLSTSLKLSGENPNRSQG